MRRLLVAEEGGPNDGGPFRKLFDAASVARQLKDLDNASCLLLWGGTDISPKLYGETANNFCESGNIPSKRDLFEWRLIEKAVASHIPIIGVCRGAQLLCAFDGGKLAQDIGGHGSGHELITVDGECFYAAANHHQMMLPLSHNEVLAVAAKVYHPGFYVGEHNAIYPIPTKFREPEVVYFPKLKALGIQPHPEWMDDEQQFVTWCLKVVNEKFFATENV
jgi:anthranilate/para-aminobenzoate synthase component II